MKRALFPIFCYYIKEHQTYNKEIGTQWPIPFPLGVGAELRRGYGGNFKHVLMASWVTPRVLTVGNKHLSKSDISIESQAPDMLTLDMRKGIRAGSVHPASILPSESVAHDLFGETDPINKLI